MRRLTREKSWTRPVTLLRLLRSLLVVVAGLLVFFYVGVRRLASSGASRAFQALLQIQGGRFRWCRILELKRRRLDFRGCRALLLRLVLGREGKLGSLRAVRRRGRVVEPNVGLGVA